MFDRITELTGVPWYIIAVFAAMVAFVFLRFIAPKKSVTESSGEFKIPKGILIAVLLIAFVVLVFLIISNLMTN